MENSKMAQVELLSYQSIELHLTYLRACGICPLDPNSSKLKVTLHTIFGRICYSFIMLYSLQQIIHVYQVRDDVDKVMDAIFLLLTYFDCICKQVAFLTKPHKIQELLKIMKGTHFNQGLEEHRPYLLEAIYQGRFLLRMFTKLCVITCILWALFPVISYLNNEHVEFTIWLPFDANESPQFYIVVCYTWLQTSWLGINNSTMDIFIMYLLVQTKTQLSILRTDLENLVNKSREDETTSSCAFTEALEHRLKGIINHYNEIIKFQSIIEEIFNGAILFQFLVSGWIICTTAYRTVNMSPASGEFISMILYMICILSELFLFCFFGNEVAHESGKVMASAYCSDWTEMPVKYRRFLIIFMERIKYPILPKAGKVVPLSINTFIQIVKTSYTYFTFLNNAGNSAISK